MTKYYVGYVQGNDEYVYVSNIDVTNVRVTTVIEGAMSFTDVVLAKNLLAIVSTLVANQEYKVLEITTEIKEVE